VSKDKSKEAAVTPREDLNAYDNVVRSNHASSIPSVDEELDPYDWHDTFEQKDLNMIKFMLENGGVSPSRSYDDANSILRYMKQVVTAAYLPRQKVVEAIGDGELATETEYGIAEIIKIGHRDELRVQIRKELGL
jgi:hypothetical protein